MGCGLENISPFLQTIFQKMGNIEILSIFLDRQWSHCFDGLESRVKWNVPALCFLLRLGHRLSYTNFVYTQVNKVGARQQALHRDARVRLLPLAKKVPLFGGTQIHQQQACNVRKNKISTKIVVKAISPEKESKN